MLQVRHRRRRGMNIVLLGRPGSGKGTQGERLAAALDLTHLSTGDLLRHAIAEDSALGRSVRATMGAGDLVDDETVAALLMYAVGGAARGLAPDRFPRAPATCERRPALDGPRARG